MQLYQYQVCTKFVPRATLGGELLVAASFNNKHSVIASFWPGFGESIDRIDPAMKRVGTIMFFLKHSVTLKEEPSVSEVEKGHIIFCRIHWQQYHSHPLHFGSSALVCTRQTEVEDACCFLPLKQIANRCSFGDITTDFGDPLGTDTAFVAISLPFNLYIVVYISLVLYIATALQVLYIHVYHMTYISMLNNPQHYTPYHYTYHILYALVRLLNILCVR